MTDLRALLAPIRARLAAATPGPWEGLLAGPRGEREWIVDSTSTFICSTQIDNQRGHSDGTLIANAPTDLARLLAAIEAVGVLHEPGPGYYASDVTCQACSNSIGYVRYPCPTVTALAAALGSDTTNQEGTQ